MIYSLDANLFGPKTQSNPGDLIASSLFLVRSGGVWTAAFVEQLTNDFIEFRGGHRIPGADLSSFPIVGIVESPRDYIEFVSKYPVVSDRLISLESIEVTDAFTGQGPSTAHVATNFPFLLRDWERTEVFRTTKYPYRDTITGKGDFVTSIGRETFVCIENAVYRQLGKPLYKNGESIQVTAEPFGSWPERDDDTIRPELTISEPVLFLAHPFSANYNIFLHETIPCVLEYDRLPAETKLFVRSDQFRLDMLQRLGAPLDKVLVAGRTHILFRRLIVPMRRLNLKYLGVTLRMVYDRLSSSLRTEAHFRERQGGYVFLNRKRVGNTGANRFMINEDEVRELLGSRNYLEIFAEDYTLAQKYDLLSGRDKIITPIGANLVNIAFSHDINEIILISNGLWAHFTHYWTELIRLRHPTAKIQVFSDCTVEDNGMSQDPYNKPYKVDLSKLASVL